MLAQILPNHFHEKDYVDHVVYFLITPDEKFLVERVEDEDDTVLMTLVRILSTSREGPRGLR